MKSERSPLASGQNFGVGSLVLRRWLCVEVTGASPVPKRGFELVVCGTGVPLLREDASLLTGSKLRTNKQLRSRSQEAVYAAPMRAQPAGETLCVCVDVSSRSQQIWTPPDLLDPPSSRAWHPSGAA